MNDPCIIDLLGGLRIRQGDRVISRFRTQKTAALLAYLAYFLKRTHAREEIVELLWPDDEPEDGRRSLRVALSSLRGQLEPPGTPFNSVLVTDRQSVRLNERVISTDAAAFESAVRAAADNADAAGYAEALRQAVDLYRGPFLPGFYDDWAIRERERLEQVYVGALDRLPGALAEAGERDAAIDYAHQRVRIDSLSEEAHCDLIRLLIEAQQFDAARGRYEEMARLLRAELGIAPPPAAQALLAALPPPRRTDRRAPGMPVKAPINPPVSQSPAPVPTPPDSPLQRAEPCLPLYLTPFFGREGERAKLHEHLRIPAARLVTLTGPGGSGKTRLAVEAARGLADSYGGRIWFVPLADIDDPDLIPDAVLRAMALPRGPGLEPAEQILQALARDRTLLILDNFEQFAETGAPVIWTLLERCPGLICLVTSRQRLDLAGEREFPVSPLAVPSAPGTPERLVEFPSVSLFVDRAQMARPDFQITRDNAAAVVAVCQRLDGIPLAIELAASWAGVLTPSQMLARLEERLTFLESRRKGGPARQRSLRDTIDWSYRLLMPELQRFFARLSVFRGGWSLEAAEAVGEEPRALAHLQGLQERSLLVTEESGSQIRFRLLETLREYAGERLRESGEAGAVVQRHLSCYLALAEKGSGRIGGAEQGVTLALLETEHDNMREALRVSVESPSAKEAGLRLAVALTPFWEVRGHLSEGRKWLEILLAGRGEASVFWRARTLGAAGTLAWQQADYASARTLFAQSLTLFRSLGERQGSAEALHGLGVVAERQADYARARALLEESLAIKRELGDRPGLAASLNTLANVLADQSDYASARALYEESLRLRRELEDRRGIGSSLNNLAIVAYEQGDFAEARTLLAESLAIRRELADLRGMAICLNNLGDLAWRGDEMATARTLYDEALAIRRQLGDRRGVASSLVHLANLTAIQDDLLSAGALYAESLVILRELEDKRGITGCLEEIAGLAARQGQPEPAARLFGAAARQRETMDAPLPPVEQADYDGKIAALRSLLPADVFEASWRTGRAMSLTEAVELALTKCRPS